MNLPKTEFISRPCSPSSASTDTKLSSSSATLTASEPSDLSIYEEEEGEEENEGISQNEIIIDNEEILEDEESLENEANTEKCNFR